MKLSFNTKSLLVIFVILCCITGVSIWRKMHYLGYTLTPNQRSVTWLIESKITFDAISNQPIVVRFSTPSNLNGYKVMQESIASAGYGFEKKIIDNLPYAIWTKRSDLGEQVIYYRFKIYDKQNSPNLTSSQVPEIPKVPVWQEAEQHAASQLFKEAKTKSATTLDLCEQLFKSFNHWQNSKEVELLIGNNADYITKLTTIQKILAMEQIPTRLAWGLDLQEDVRNRHARQFLEVYDQAEWHIFDPILGTEGLAPNTILLTQGDEALLDVVGGKNSKVTFSIARETIDSNNLISERAEVTDLHQSFRFSLHNLPLESQNTFQLLMMFPLGILIVVFIRNIIGITTLGTFMPILIGLAFLETGIQSGLFYFCIIIAIGLLIRGYLSRLNLLLVPRIGAVVVVVIIIMQILTILSYQLGFQSATTITYFPIIILAWTIERVSIKWEEDGPRNALKETFASVVTGLVTYFIISNAYVRHLIYSFNEINLVILGFILLIGTYTGYRLTELHRFNVLVKNHENP